MPRGWLVPWINERFFRSIPSAEDEHRFHAEVMRLLGPERPPWA